MQDKFEELLETEDRDKKAEIKAFFLEKTADKLESTGKESALKVAAAFDRFKKRSGTDRRKPLYTTIRSFKPITERQISGQKRRFERKKSWRILNRKNLLFVHIEVCQLMMLVAGIISSSFLSRFEL